MNWANSGPGFSWPLDYYVAWLPFYDEYVVTVSYDDPIVAGYLDLAIGNLPEKAEVEVHLKQVIQTHWEETAEYLHGCRNAGTMELWRIHGLGGMKYPGPFQIVENRKRGKR